MNFPSRLRGLVLAAVVDDDDFSLERVSLQELGRGLHVPGDLPAFLEGRYDDR
jgi:hypothetical protein